MVFKTKFVRGALAACAAAAAFCPGLAQAWWNAEWGYRKALTLDTSAQGVQLSAPLAEVPVLVRLHTGNFQYFLDVLDGGADLRFVAGEDATPLEHHVERFDPINEMAFIWVRVPELAPNSAEGRLWMYYGNPAAPPGEDRAATWDTPTALVYHFGESAGGPMDATAYGNHAVAFTGTPSPASLIGGGARFGGDSVLAIAESPSLWMSAASGWTFSTWVKVDAPQSAAVLMDRPGASGRLSLHVDGTSVHASYAAAGAAPVQTPAVANLTPGTWHHLALVAGNGQLTVVLDGLEAGSAPAALADLGGPITVGSSAEGSGFFTGELDELQIATVVRSLEWLRLAARAQGADPRLVGYGADETPESAGAEQGGGHGGTFGIIFQSVFGNEGAIVEQVVIGICVLMMVVAVMVMVLKAAFLSGAAAANRKFLRDFEALGEEGGRGGLPVLVGQKAYRKSPLYRLYTQGIEEVQKRVSPPAGAAHAGLDAKAMTTIKAAMDAVMVREGQRLNAQMVLLTIAISGGPFIGLLGTVVGVMVTFAAIAATGDVNIAAIAPGMAAALLATVAGLGVAIPALFGYNYLGSRAKEISADMHVFADELIARIGETYGR